MEIIKKENGKTSLKISQAEWLKIGEENNWNNKTMTQQEAISKFMPLINNGKIYEKKTQVLARPAKEGEKIDTTTSDGKETSNTAGPNSVVVKNLTEAKEEYILDKTKFEKRYIKIQDENPPWSRYQATGSAQGVSYNGQPTEFIASWGEKMVLKPGDMIVTPLPAKNEVYRIARKEFEETYGQK